MTLNLLLFIVTANATQAASHAFTTALKYRKSISLHDTTFGVIATATAMYIGELLQPVKEQITC